MATLVVPTAVRYALVHTHSNGREVVNTVACRVASTANTLGSRAADVQWTALKVMAKWSTRVMPLLVDNLQLIRCDYVDLNSATGSTGSVAQDPPTVGGVAGAATPPNIAAVARKESLRERGAKAGRLYLMAVTEANVDENGTILTPNRTAIQDALALFRTDVNTTLGPDPATTTLGVIRRVIGDQGVIDDVSSFSVLPVVGTQRRRLVR